MSLLSNFRKAVARTISMTAQAERLTRQQQAPNLSDNDGVYSDGGNFSPAKPLTPYNQGRAPWQYQYQVGSNTNITPKTEEDAVTLMFGILRQVAQNHDITALCIKLMIDQVTGDEWDIVVADKNDREHHEADIIKVREFFKHPDKTDRLFSDWLKPLLYDCLSVDAATLYKRRTRDGKLYSLEYVDGTTIKPLININGRIPQPPYAAYQQIIYGYPRGSSVKQAIGALGFTTDDLSYRPRYPRSFSRYGFSPVENILMKINIAMRRDTMSLNYYTNGTTPDGGIFSFANENMTVDQCEQFARLYTDIMSGNLKERYKLRFLPKGSYIPTKDQKFDVSYDEWIARIVAIAFGVNPQQFIMVMNRSTGQLQDEQQTELGLAPLENYLAEWFTDIIQKDLGFPHLAFRFIGEKREDKEMGIKRDVEFVQSGILTIDEVRSQRGMPPITGLKDGTPPFVKVGNDVILLTEDYIKAKSEAQIKALEFGNVQAGNQSNLEAKLRESQEKPTPQNDTQGEESEQRDKTIAQEENTSQKAAQSELRSFRKFAMNQLKKRAENRRKFVPKVLSKDFCDEISHKLTKASTEENVSAIFDEASYQLAVDNAIEQSQEEFDDLFEEFQQYLADNFESHEGESEDKSKAKKLALLFMLLGSFGFKDKLDGKVKEMLNRYSSVQMSQIAKEIQLAGGQLTPQQKTEIIQRLIDERENPLVRQLMDTTVKRFTDWAQGDEPLEQGNSQRWELSDARAGLIAKNEYYNLQNKMAVAAAKHSSDVVAIYVTDGVMYDAICATANGQVWSIDYFESNPHEHPNCIREGHPVGREFVEAHGGIDVE